MDYGKLPPLWASMFTALHHGLHFNGESILWVCFSRSFLLILEYSIYTKKLIRLCTISIFLQNFIIFNITWYIVSLEKLQEIQRKFVLWQSNKTKGYLVWWDCIYLSVAVTLLLLQVADILCGEFQWVFPWSFSLLKWHDSVLILEPFWWVHVVAVALAAGWSLNWVFSRPWPQGKCSCWYLCSGIRWCFFH